MLKIIVAAIIALTALFYSTFSVAQSAKDSLHNRIERILEENQVPGAAVAMVSGDSIIWMDGFGQANVKEGLPVTKNTLFCIGSISKTFLAASAFAAQEKKLLNLNDPIRVLAPSLPFTNQWTESDPVRLIHLLEHTSGFDEAHFHLFAHADAATPLNKVMELSPNALTARWKPGTYYAYNNLGAVAAACVIQEAVDQPFEGFVRDNILLPLDIKEATYRPDESPAFARGYSGDTNKEEPFPELPQWPAGALNMSANHMANFLIMLLNDGQFRGQQVLSPSSVRRMEIPESSLRAGMGVSYGYSKGLQGRFEHGYLFYGHTGRYGGFSSEFGYSKEAGVGYIILLNHADGNKAIRKMKQELFGYLPPGRNEKPVTVRSADLPPVTGCYQPVSSEMQLTQFAMRLIDLQFVTREGGQLYQRSIMGDEQPLFHVSDTLFRRQGETIATSAFTRDSNGNWLWLDETSYRRIPAWWGYFQFYFAALCLVLILLGLVSLVVWIPIRLIKGRKQYFFIQLLPFLAICSLILMVLSVALLFDPFQKYSTGAILFLLSGWLFMIFSLAGFATAVWSVYKNIRLSKVLRHHALIISFSCLVTAVYLLAHGVIGLSLWSY